MQFVTSIGRFLHTSAEAARVGRAADGCALDDVRHLIAAVQYAQILEARFRACEYFQVGLDLLRSIALGSFLSQEGRGWSSNNYLFLYHGMEHEFVQPDP